MEKRVLLVLCLVLLTAISAPAYARKLQVGVSPSVLDLGEIERGDSHVASFSILTPSEDSFMVEMSKDMGGIEFFDKKKYMGYVSGFSEQDALDWIDFITNPVYLDTSIEGSGMKKAETIKFLVNIPEDAEPGYHVFQIAPRPAVSGGGGTGVSIVAVAKLEVLLQVPGQAVRDAEVLDILGNREGDKTRIDVYVQNTGTVTISARASSVKVFNLSGDLVGETGTSQEKIAPGEVASLRGHINEPLGGDYRVSAVISYSSGESEGEAVVSIMPSTAAQATGKITEAAIFPWWAAIIIILIVAYGAYRWL